jgi:hypothetical protein
MIGVTTFADSGQPDNRMGCATGLTFTPPFLHFCPGKHACFLFQ